ncbi:ABC transporter B family member 19 isoform X2 [Medicago truncatula]|uniref:ABC transporter B family member 19 isoform X2 n=1 Tax=Medicago truncatula TaxID=3880 RepID=UPI000D2F16E5|nr:ABC transporter B family member 19 isoform X2 [Medicago truncatula]
MISNKKNPTPVGYFFRLLKMNAPEWPYSIMGAVGFVLSGFIGPTFAIVMSNMIEVFYYRNYASMEKKTKEYVFVYIGAGIFVVGAYLIQHYFFSIMGENLTTRVRRMMLAGPAADAAVCASPSKGLGRFFGFLVVRFEARLWL